ncbi:hypothetical protein [Rickettsiella endosymbiont of Miltochrista miniata]|uniref:hypothetical protein n=1 Tax=Rickettsiella endosymbiont of Miltochrista miniata TaxID=3066239 RepID=UPI00313BE81D
MPIKELNKLYDVNKFPGVSAETRTDIIGAIAFDVEGLTLNEGGKYTEKELCEGLRYLLATNKHLHTYLEPPPSSSRDSSYLSRDPFYIPTDHLLFSYLLLNPAYDSGNSCVPSDGCDGNGDNEGALVICIAIVALAFAAGFCYCTGKNTYSTLESNESNSVKAAKIILTLSVFATTFALTYYVVPIDDEVIRAIIALPIAAAPAALTSYISKLSPCLPKITPPNKELLDELQTVKHILERGHARQGDNKEQCKKFIKEAVRYYIQSISSDHNIEFDQPHHTVIEIGALSDEPSAPLLPESHKQYGSFFKYPTVNDERSSIITEPVTACCKMTNHG